MSNIVAMTFQGNIPLHFNELFNNIANTNIDTNIQKHLKTIKIGHFTMLCTIGILLFILLLKSKGIISDFLNYGIFTTWIKNPILPLISFIIQALFYVNKRTLFALKNIPKNSEKNKNEKKLCKTSWIEIGEITNTNIETIYKYILNNFKNEEIYNFIKDDDIKFNVNISEDEYKNTYSKFEKNNNVKLIDFENNIQKVKFIFADKYKKYKTIEKKLLDIKNTVIEVNKWTNDAKKFLDKMNDSKKIKDLIFEYKKQKIDDMKYIPLLKEYRSIFIELKSLIKILNKNPETEMISKCPVCLTNVKNAFIIPCGHCVCKECLSEQKKINNKLLCPICRTEGKKIGDLFY